MHACEGALVKRCSHGNHWRSGVTWKLGERIHPKGAKASAVRFSQIRGGNRLSDIQDRAVLQSRLYFSINHFASTHKICTKCRVTRDGAITYHQVVSLRAVEGCLQKCAHVGLGIGPLCNIASRLFTFVHLACPAT